jgi:D-sedoheptulose 7-phosphate isomerase
MSMLEQRIQQQLFDGADFNSQAAESLARPVADAARALVAGFTAGGRLLVGGHGHAIALGHLLVAQLVGCFERERPGLAALALPADGGLVGAALAPDAPDSGLARQVQTLGQPGDLLLLIDAESAGAEAAASLVAAVKAAHGKDMTVLALTGIDGARLADELTETDVLIAIRHERRARVLELQLAVLNCLCDAIDLQLLGEQDSA